MKVMLKISDTVDYVYLLLMQFHMLQSCNIILVDGTWSDWSEWGDCSSECTGGTQERTRTCEGQEGGGADCVGETSETQACNEDISNPCGVNSTCTDDVDGYSCECDAGYESTNDPKDGKSCQGKYSILIHYVKLVLYTEGHEFDWAVWVKKKNLGNQLILVQIYH